MQEPLRPECSRTFSDHDKRIALSEQKLGTIEEQVTNHLPSAVEEVRKEMKEGFEKWDSRMWKLILILAGSGMLGGGGAYGIVEVLK